MSARAAAARERFVKAPLVIDCEYIKHYTTRHREAVGSLSDINLHAECHAFALERLTPVIREGDLIAVNKTQHLRGVIPYANYASLHILKKLAGMKEFEGEPFEGIPANDFFILADKYLLHKEEVDTLHDVAQYWSTRCMQARGDQLWQHNSVDAPYLFNGWETGLFKSVNYPAPSTHLVLDFETALREGMVGTKLRLETLVREQHITSHETARKVEFWQAGIRVLEGVMEWSRNYATEARAQADQAEDKERREELLTMANSCRRTPAYAPLSFREAMQSWWTMNVAAHIEGGHVSVSAGRFDRYMWPLFVRDIQRGILTNQEAVEELETMRVKCTELQSGTSLSGAASTLVQNLMLGGVNEEGEPADNQLSTLLLQAAIDCPCEQPELDVWYDESMDAEFLKKSAECAKVGTASPQFFNCKQILSGGLAEDVDLATFRKHACMDGCNVPFVEGHSYGATVAGMLNHAKLLELAMFGGKDPRTGVQFDATPLPETAKELEEAYYVHMKKAVTRWEHYSNCMTDAHRDFPLIFGSILTGDCVRRGRSLDEGGALCNNATVLSCALANVADSVTAVEHVVDSGKFTMEEMRTALLTNWDGTHNKLKKLCVAAPKCGVDEEADAVYTRLFNTYRNALGQVKDCRGEPFDSTILHVCEFRWFDRVVGATPDGRAKGDALSDGDTFPYEQREKSLACSEIGMFSSDQLGELVKTYFDAGVSNVQFLPTEEGLIMHVNGKCACHECKDCK